MAPNARVAKAFRAMREIGIPEEKVKPVLKHLLGLYDKNWLLIEAENYRALADAIFEQEESQGQVEEQNRMRKRADIQDMKDAAQLNEEPEYQLKKLRRDQEHQASPSVGNPSSKPNGTLLKQPKEEVTEVELPNETPLQSCSQRVTELNRLNAEETSEGSHSMSCPSLVKRKGKQPMLPEPSSDVADRTLALAANGTKSGSVSSTTGSEKGKELVLKEPKVEPGISLSPKQGKTSTVLTKLNDVPVTDDVPLFAVSLELIVPEPMVAEVSSLLGDSVRMPHSPRPLVSHPVQDGVRTDEPMDAETSSLLGDSVRMSDYTEPLVSHPVQDGVKSDEPVDADNSSLLGDSVRTPDHPEPLVSHPVQDGVRSDEPMDAETSSLLGDSVRMPDYTEPLVSHPVQDGVRSDELMDAENSSLLGDSVRMPVCLELLAAHPVQDGVGSDGMPASSNDGGDNRENLTMETINETPAIGIPKQQSFGSDALDVADKAIGLDNGSINSQNVNGVSQILVPMQISSSNGNDCNKNVNDTDNHISGVDKKKELLGLEHVNSQDLAVQQHRPTPNGGRLFHDVIDITNGLEKVAISAVNEVNDESLPSFRYIPKNVVFRNAYIDFSLARIGKNCCSACSDDCLSSPTPCACAIETGGEYAYTSEGIVKEDILKESISMNRHPEQHCLYYCTDCPLERSENDGEVEKCQGHLVRTFIKECWVKCGCNNQCGNRVVQRGISRKLQVFMTPEGKGWGLRTLEDLPEGVFVCEYVGEILTNAELSERVSQKSSGHVHSYPVLLDADWGAEKVLKDEEALCLDATHYGNVARFVNHRCEDSNMVEIPVEVETPDHHYYHLAFFTTREVKALEELTWDYGINFDDKAHPVKAFKCRCGSKLCRNKKRPNKSRRIRYGGRRR